MKTHRITSDGHVTHQLPGWTAEIGPEQATIGFYRDNHLVTEMLVSATGEASAL